MPPETLQSEPDSRSKPEPPKPTGSFPPVRTTEPPAVLPPSAAAQSWFGRRSLWLRVLVVLALACITVTLLVYGYYARMVDRLISQGATQVGTMVYSTPFVIAQGAPYSEAEVVRYLQQAGYRESVSSRMGTFKHIAGGIEVATGPDSYFQSHVARISFKGDTVSGIYSVTNNRASDRISLEPELVTNLVAGDREKRRPVQYSDLPKHLIQALISTEDKRFFEHGGLDLLRVLKAAYVDVKEQRKEQGASTLTMQLARNFFLDQEKTWKRKFTEVMITTELERRFTKEQILELYANEVYLGRRGSFSIHGFGQAARSYFGKEINQLTVPESALLVGMIQRPAYYNPFKYPERTKTRRDLVLTLMYNNGYITAPEMAAAQSAPLELSRAEVESSEAPYFVDLVNNEVDDVLGEKDVKIQSYRLYTSLDMNLQREAVAAIKAALPEVDKNARRAHKKKKELPEVALVALDPHTGAVRALVGGRDYARSQLNRALAKRQPGSSFKPFVYATAIQTAVTQTKDVITPATHVLDEPTTFHFANQEYSPGNFDKTFHGSVTLRYALMHSLNVPTVKVAEKVGYDKVVQLAKAAGLNENLQATPAIALGAYEVTPLEIASAYTTFSNGGVHEDSFFIDSARDRKNNVVYNHSADQNQVLDPRVAYIMVNMMEDVLNHGTAAGARSRGFKAPAAGKTGTSRDGWFAGFTSNLLTVVWVGYDDNTELDLEGAKSALPIWTEFMKRAIALPAYRDVKPFATPAGVVKVAICDDSGQRATPECPSTRTEVFVDGSQPRTECQLHSGGFFQDFVGEPGQPPQQTGNKPGFFGKVLGVFR